MLFCVNMFTECCINYFFQEATIVFFLSRGLERLKYRACNSIKIKSSIYSLHHLDLKLCTLPLFYITLLAWQSALMTELSYTDVHHGCTSELKSDTESEVAHLSKH